MISYRAPQMGDVLVHLVCVLLLWDANFSSEMFLAHHHLYDGFMASHFMNGWPLHLCNCALLSMP